MGLRGDRELVVKLLLSALLLAVWGADVDGGKVNLCNARRTCNT